eukprot:CAMPEP_0181341548 /NCGR_PEP_ID=MMETSP1101-20121128/30477_1 /TAXON_ID=46948 /ORGANISM="Rhodomonas abbreviata, Strain Caron Lab Isolate" /LENGTH=81 /DNA_ID=CAMNT_0023452849 /DNA_START=320 /DNA_END=565 /DNA_ORIENTATION=-
MTGHVAGHVTCSLHALGEVELQRLALLLEGEGIGFVFEVRLKTCTRLFETMDVGCLPRHLQLQLADGVFEVADFLLERALC